jgi:transcription antitermination factor NusG
MNNWSVIQTRSRWEKKVARLLQQKGIETFCPLQKARRQWSDRVKTIEMPLFNSVIFVRVSEDQRTIVRLTEGVLNFVYRSGKPVVLKEKIIQGIQQFQAAYPELDVMETGMIKNGNELTPARSGKNITASLWIEGLNLLLVPCLATPKLIGETTDKI